MRTPIFKTSLLTCNCFLLVAAAALPVVAGAVASPAIGGAGAIRAIAGRLIDGGVADLFKLNGEIALVDDDKKMIEREH